MLGSLKSCPSQAVEQTLSNGADELLCGNIWTVAQVRQLSRHGSKGADEFLCWNIQTNAQVRKLNRHSATELMD
jgi:hypothetical protein